jgi:1-deoxy-D-xylulose-5-phosphate synthase
MMAESILSNIQFPIDYKSRSVEELEQLCKELRSFIIEEVAKNGGHLGASLGVVELTVALHYVFDTPNDLLIWDVGHQAYGHKILTGRKDQFHTNRKLNGISGFPKRAESVYDAFGTGHSSTSISAMLGMAVADRIQGIERQHIAVIGDASMQAGMAFEALNHAGISDTNMIVILNDNRMSIDPSVGALNAFLSESASSFLNEPVSFQEQLHNPSAKTNLFKDLHFEYFGPIDGHSTVELVGALEHLKSIDGPKLLHILTTKGKGYEPAEQGDATKWHAPGLFDPLTGKVLKKDSATSKPPKFQEVFGETLVELAKSNKKIVGVTPAMPTGSSLKLFMDEFPTRAFDVGIAEQHAVTFSAGLAVNGLIPFCAIYSTFLQRAYDQLIHDVAIQDLKVVFCIDRAGLVGEDGATHHGVYDLAYLRCVPNLIIAAPRNEVELRNILYTAQLDSTAQSVAIRYPRGRGEMVEWREDFKKVEIGTSEVLKEGNRVAILTIGTMANEALNAAELLEEKGILVSVIDMRFVKPLDTNCLDNVLNSFKHLVTCEDGTVVGGFGSAISEYASHCSYRGTIHSIGIPDEVVHHGSPQELKEQCGMDALSIVQTIVELLND